MYLRPQTRQLNIVVRNVNTKLIFLCFSQPKAQSTWLKISQTLQEFMMKMDIEEGLHVFVLKKEIKIR